MEPLNHCLHPSTRLARVWLPTFKVLNTACSNRSRVYSTSNWFEAASTDPDGNLGLLFHAKSGKQQRFAFLRHASTQGFIKHQNPFPSLLVCPVHFAIPLQVIDISRSYIWAQFHPWGKLTVFRAAPSSEFRPLGLYSQVRWNDYKFAIRQGFRWYLHLSKDIMTPLPHMTFFCPALYIRFRHSTNAFLVSIWFFFPSSFHPY